MTKYNFYYICIYYYLAEGAKRKLSSLRLYIAERRLKAMIKVKWINNYTGQLYTSNMHMVVTIIKDMIFFKNCRTIKMLNVSRMKGE